VGNVSTFGGICDTFAVMGCNFLLLYEHVIFVFLQYEKNVEKEAYIINLLIILGKFHIHWCKFTNR